jgi:hypothetical protein
MSSMAVNCIKNEISFFKNYTADTCPEKNRIKGLCDRNVLPPSDKL